jgi:hypothetical protein
MTLVGWYTPQHVTDSMMLAGGYAVAAQHVRGDLGTQAGQSVLLQSDSMHTISKQPGGTSV